jgi:hypothetical protein
LEISTLHICFVEILVLIQQYLNGDLSYQQGVAIYTKYGDNATLKKMFADAEDDYSIKKLHKELQAIEKRLKLNADNNAYKSFTQSKLKGKINVEILPTHLRELYHKLSSLIREMALLHSRLTLYPTDAERFEASAKIIELSEERRIIFTRCDYFMEHGKDHPAYALIEVEEPQTTGISYFEAQYKLKLLRSQKSKLKDNPKRAADFQKICEEISIYETVVNNGKGTV